MSEFMRIPEILIPSWINTPPLRREMATLIRDCGTQMLPEDWWERACLECEQVEGDARFYIRGRRAGLVSFGEIALCVRIERPS